MKYTVPIKCPYQEILPIRPSEFEEMKDREGNSNTNYRDFAADSVCLPDAEMCRDRRGQFQAFHILEGVEELPYKS